MNILVAGGTGHTGERVVQRLLADGHRVSVLSRKPASNAVVDGLLQAGAGLAAGDCTRRWTLWQALEGRDALIGCAHVRFAPACVQACRQTGVTRYIQMSSARGQSRFTEHPSVCEVRRGERAVLDSDLVYTIVRATMIYGGRRDGNMEKLVAWFRRRRWFPLVGSGLSLVQPVFVDDVVEGIAKSLARPEGSAGHVFTLAGGSPLAYREMISTVCRAIRREPPLFIPLPAAPCRIAAHLLGKRNIVEMIDRLTEDRSASTAEVREMLGIVPVTFDEGMKRKLRLETEIFATR